MLRLDVSELAFLLLGAEKVVGTVALVEGVVMLLVKKSLKKRVKN